MIMKIDNHKQFMCPQTAGKEKPNGCRGNKCAAFRLYGTHYLVKHGQKTYELMYYCGLAKAPQMIEAEYQYPHHAKETELWRNCKSPTIEAYAGPI